MQRYVKPAIAVLLLAVSVLFLLSGFGITNAVVVLDKPLSLKLHSVLWAPFVALLAAHLLLPLVYRQQGNKR